MIRASGRRSPFSGIASASLLSFVILACGPTPPRAAEPASERAEPPTSAPAPSDTPPPGVPEPATAAEPRLLPVPGFGDAVLVSRVGGPALPLLLAAHGAGDGPEWQCEHWGKVLATRFVVLCPRGLSLGKGDSGYYFKDHFALEREVLAAVDTARKTLAGGLLAEGGTYIAYSQGATMGALMLVEHGALFPHLVLIEGGSGDWTIGRARRFHATGGKSVAIVCGTSPCARRAKSSAAVLEKAGLRARAEHVEGGGHAYWGAVGERALALFDDWLFHEP